jgi:hypothetical protein
MPRCSDCGHVRTDATEPYVCEACLERRAAEFERAVDRLLSVEWLAEALFLAGDDSSRRARQIAEVVIAEAKKP